MKRLSVVDPELAGAIKRERFRQDENIIPYDPAKPAVGSGIRLGTLAVTRQGFTEEDMVIVANLISDVLEAPEDEGVLARVRKQAQALTAAHPLFYG